MKLDAGSLHVGLGYSHITRFLQTLKIPYICSRTFKKREREVGIAVEKLAKKSCKAAVELEKKLTREKADDLKKYL